MIKKDGRLVKWFFFQMYECSRVEKFITDMAKKGWMLESFKGSKFTFRPCEPVELRFSVELFDLASETGVTNDATKTYIEFCERAGWNYVAGDRKIHIFSTNNYNVVPIETDDEITLSIINKNILKTNLYVWFMLPFLAVLTMKNNFDDFQYFITDYFSIALCITWVLLLINSLIGIINYLIWYISTKRRIKCGNAIKYYDGKNRTILMAINMTVCLAILAFFNIVEILEGNLILLTSEIVLAVFIIIPAYFMKRKEFSIKMKVVTTFLITLVIIFLGGFVTFMSVRFVDYFKNNARIIVYLDDEGLACRLVEKNKIPVSLEDYGVPPKNSVAFIRETSADVSATVFAQSYTYYDYYSMKNDDNYFKRIDYELFESDFQWVMDQYVKQCSHPEYHAEISEVDPTEFGADRLFVEKYEEDAGMKYIAIYGNKVFTLSVDEVPTRDQINLFIQKLNLS